MLDQRESSPVLFNAVQRGRAVTALPSGLLRRDLCADSAAGQLSGGRPAKRSLTSNNSRAVAGVLLG